MKVIKLTHNALIQGTQQHPHTRITAAKENTAVSNDMITPFHLPNRLENQSSRMLFTPEFSFISCESVRTPSKALVTEPYEAVLFGMNVQHWSPNTEQTPPFSASNMSSAIQFYTVITVVAVSCSTIPSIASRVKLANRCTF